MADPHNKKTDEESREYLEILRANLGFDQPERWLKYARDKNFKRVKAYYRDSCPDCGSTARRCLAYFIYYSNRSGLQECYDCHLVFTDAILAPETTTGHFELAYKDAEYFEHSRADIFGHILEIISTRTPKGGRVVDGGGAQGHLLAALAKARPDLELVLNDISQVACEYASRKYNLKTLRGSLMSIATLSPVSTLVLIDSIYYEPDVRTLWESLLPSLEKGGNLIIRIPNKICLIKLLLWPTKLLSFIRRRPGQTTITGFNPEHVSVFTRQYLSNRLSESGMEDIEFMPSPLLIKRPIFRSLIRLWYNFAELVFKLSGKRCILTPSMLVLARRKGR